ncbi:MAG: M24 family metallopeptidase [Bacteriovoracaceae bacterium]|nr:M24 family metallopeptidase [Bacteriovoracaceae bacterium]
MGKASFKLTQSEVQNNVTKLKEFMNKEGLDAFYISSFDPYLNEYVPMENCHRFYFTNFNGSVAELLVLKDERVRLYVDGRYWEQADLQVDPSVVEVVKVQANKGLGSQLLEDLESIKPKNLGYEGDRTSLKFFQALEERCEVKGYFNEELSSLVDFKKMPALAPITYIPRKYRGRDTKEKLEQAIKHDKHAYFVSAIDSLAWITNSRGYHLPNLASFLGKALATHDKVFVFIDEDTPLDDSIKDNSVCEFYQLPAAKVESKLQEIQDQYKLQSVDVDPQMLNVLDYKMLNNVFGADNLTESAGGLVEFHSIKDPEELAHMEEGFNKADKAIFNTIKWVKESLKAGKKVSELDLYNETTVKYEEQGSKEQSFGTIAGAGPNGSIIHYSEPKEDVILKDDDMVLLDSGGYFEGGFATDTTRTFMASDKEGSAEQKKIYTLVLKGTLNCQSAVFPEGTSGKVIDGYARHPLHRHGYDFRHGTGHGVGVHVHEGGVRISPASDVPMKEGQVVSIEPGIYIPGFAGVRLENIAYVEKHPEFEGFLRFRPLVYIGFEPKLIDYSLLNDDEKAWLEAYEAECSRRGTSFQ